MEHPRRCVCVVNGVNGRSNHPVSSEKMWMGAPKALCKFLTLWLYGSIWLDGPELTSSRPLRMLSFSTLLRLIKTSKSLPQKGSWVFNCQHVHFELVAHVLPCYRLSHQEFLRLYFQHLTARLIFRFVKRNALQRCTHDRSMLQRSHRILL